MIKSLWPGSLEDKSVKSIEYRRTTKCTHLPAWLISKPHLNIPLLSSVFLFLPPPLPHALSSQEYPLDTRASFDEQHGIPTDVDQHEVLGYQVGRFPTRGPDCFLLVRLQWSLDHDKVAHLAGDREHKEGVEHNGEVVTQPFHPTKCFTRKTSHFPVPLYPNV